MLARRLSPPVPAVRHIRVVRLYSATPAIRASQATVPTPLKSQGSRRATSSTHVSSRKQFPRNARESRPDRYSDVAEEEAREIFERTMHFQVEGGISSMEDALTVWRALEAKYGLLRDIVFPRDSVNTLKFAPSCIALFDQPFPPDFEYDTQVLAVELPTEVPANGGPGLAAVHELLSGPSYTVDVPARPRSQASDSETSRTSEAGASSQPTQAFTLRDSTGNTPRIVTVTGSRPNALYHHRYAHDAPRSTLVMGPQHSFARLWAAFGGFAPSTASPNMRMASTIEVARAFVEAHPHDAPVVGEDQIGLLIQAAQTPQASPVPKPESTETHAEAVVEMSEESTPAADEQMHADEFSEHTSWSPITTDASTIVSATNGRISTRATQLSKEEIVERRALAALYKARAAEAAEKARVAELARNTRASKAAAAVAAEKAEKGKRRPKQEAQRARRSVADHRPHPVVKSAKPPVSSVKAQSAAAQSKAAPATAASGEAPKQLASAQRQQRQPEQRKSGILGKLLGW